MRSRSPSVVIALTALALLTTLTAACGPGFADDDPATVELTVYAAASLRGALDEVVPAYRLVAPGVTLTVSTGASSALRTQIEQGAPADVFLSADTQEPAALVEAGRAAGDARVFAANELAIIVPAANPATIATPRDLARPGVKVVAAGDAVPITRYTTTLVENLAALEPSPAGFATAYAANVVSREDDVRAIVAKIELGEGDAAIVYRTDALASDKLDTIGIPAAARVSATYAGIVVNRSAEPDEGRAFLDWLVGPEGQDILGSVGFSSPAR